MASPKRPINQKATDSSASERKLQRKQNQARRTRRAIIEAAERVIARHGLEGATMEQVAREAGYSVGALYNYFKSKTDLETALISSVIEDALDTLRRPLPSSLDTRQRFELLMLRMLENVESSKAWIVAMKRDLVKTRLVGEESDSLHKLAKTYIAEHMKLAISAGAVREDMDPNLAAIFMLSVLEGMIVDWFREGSKESLTDRAPLIVQLTFNGIAAR